MKDADIPVEHQRWRAVFRTVSSFFLGQGALQAISALGGIFLVRTLSVEAYAQFGLAFGFQATAASLMDLGFASTIIPLVGSRVHDAQVVGTYVRAAIRLRNRAFFILAPFTALAFVLIARTHHWSNGLQVLLIVPVLVALYSSGNISCYSVPFFLHRHLAQYYAVQTLSGLVRLTAYVVFQMLGGLNSWTAGALSALNFAYVSRALAKKGSPWIGPSGADTRNTEREIIHYVMPAMPAILVGGLQPQISLFLISIFGQTTSMAQVAALGRIAQLFTVLQVFNMVVVEPYIARLSRDRLRAVYLKLIALAAMCCIPLVAFGFLVPGPILWLIGPKYSELRGVVGWLMLGSCVNYLAVLAWVMNRARKWVFWSGTVVEIALLMVVQVAFIVTIGVHTTQQAVIFSLATSCCLAVAHAYNGIYGFLRGPRVSVTIAEG